MNRHLSTIIFTAAAALTAGTAAAQTLGYTKTDKIKIAGVSSDGRIDTLSTYHKQTTIVYYDGLGRPLQAVVEQASPGGKDMIQPVYYDTLGRQTTSYLPYSDEQGAYATGAYRSNALTGGQKWFYNQTTQYLVPVDTQAYSQQVFEKTPLQRLLNAGMTGAGFQPTAGHCKTISYRPSTVADSVLLWTWNGTTYTTTRTTCYAANLLWVTDGKDEDGVETLAFADLEGHTVLKKQILSSGNLNTYYIYNNAGMVAYIVPPLATNALPAASYSLTASPIVNMIYKFIYDDMGRLIQKTVPAKGKVSIVYDPYNRPLLSQDTNMAAKHKWYYVKYDAKNRAIGTGIYTDASHVSQPGMQNYVNGLAWAHYFETRSTTRTDSGYYTNNVFPSSGISPLSWAYYDNYNMKDGSTADFSFSTTQLAGDTVTTAPIKGMPTISVQTVVGSGIAATTWLTKVVFYNRRLNAIQVQSNNAVYVRNMAKVTDYQTVLPDFTGVPQITKVSKQTASATTATIQTNLTYDQSYRITAVDQYYNGSSTVNHISKYTYSEAGQVVLKNLGFVSGTTWLQNVDYRYNIRGQIMNINNSKLTPDTGKTNTDSNDVFGMDLFYNTSDGHLTSQVYYDGKMASAKWMALNASGAKGNERAFIYNYDAVNRYTGETYGERTTTTYSPFTITHGWDETNIKYDANGNITSLKRDSSVQNFGAVTAIDELKYTYSTTIPDQLASVYDTTGKAQGFIGGTGTYGYDPEGNLNVDPYQGITHIAYNVLNKTDTTKLTATTYITYTYDASGSLIRKKAYNSSTLTQTDYIDGFVYTGNGTTQTLAYAPMPEGRLLGTALTQEYVIVDPQGNARVAFQNVSGAAKVTQENSYYGYGLIMPGSLVSPPSVPNKNLYNGGSEWQNDTKAVNAGVPDYYQTFYRNYDPALARFVAVDPEAEGAESMSDYHYAGDNPIGYNDPMGNLARLKINQPNPQAGIGDPSLEGGGGGYVDPTGSIGTNSDPNWMNDGAFDDEGTFSSDQGAAGRAFWLKAEMNGGALDPASGNVQTIYTAGDDGTPSTGSLKNAVDITNTYLKGNGYAPLAANTFWVYVDALGNIMHQDAGVGNGGVQYFADFQTTFDGTIINNVYGGEISGDNQGGQQPLTHAQELAKYGQISWGYNISGGASAGSLGGNVEIGTVITNKGWARDYKTVYASPGLASPSLSHSFFFIYSTQSNNLPTFSDWNGLSEGLSGSFDFVSVGGGLGSNYWIWSLGGNVAPESLNFTKMSNGASMNFGYTTMGAPYRLDGMSPNASSYIYEMLGN